MTFTISFGPWTWTIIAVILGMFLIANDDGGILPGPLGCVGVLLWLSIPLIWIGWWMCKLA